MKSIIAAATLAALAVSPSLALAAKAKHHAYTPAAYDYAPPYAVMAPPNSVVQGNQIVGADPDPTVRLDLQRETSTLDGGSN